MEAEKRSEEDKKRRMEAEKKFNDVDILHSVEDILNHIPLMRLNESCPPSIIPNEKAREEVQKYRVAYAKYVADLNLYNEGGSGSKNDDTEKPKPPEKFKFHELAKVSMRRIQDDLFDFNINVIRSDGLREKSSLSLEAQGGLPHFNETSPKDAFSHVIKDVVRCSRIAGISVVKEATLFSLRPDLVVVFVNGYLLFIVEIKNPSKNDDAVFVSETAGGQVLDYGKVNQQSGLDCPFVILSTYNHSVIATLPIPDGDTMYEEILKEGSANANQKPSQRVPPTETPRKKPLASSESLSQDHMLQWKLKVIDQAIVSNSEEEEEEIEERGSAENSRSSEPFDYQGREVIYSQTFDYNMNYKMVTLVLESALVASERPNNASRKPLLPPEGSILEGQYCTLTETGFSWEPVNIECVTYNKAPLVSKMKKYHAICQLGQGGSCKTILCCSSGGRMFSVKLFLFTRSTQFRAEDREEEEEEEEEEAFQKAMEEAKQERDRWHLLAPAFKSFCHVIKLNGLPAITMPYFQPIPFDKRIYFINMLDAKLPETAKKGFYYAEDEMRWRLFGCRWIDEEKVQLTLLDLGSLHEKQAEGQGIGVDDDVLRRQIESLRSRSGKEGIAKPKLVFT